jgi:NADP-dependent 3-hydroxy acid dehydrogenase YdfG
MQVQFVLDYRCPYAYLANTQLASMGAEPDAPDDFFIQPADIANEVWHVVHQPRSAWSFNVEMRPHKENW